MICRCEKPETNRYERYGGRGISVCEDWHDFHTFRNWSIDNGYRNGLSIERVDYNGNYEPSNCKYITFIEQANNRSNNRIETYQGVTDTVANLCRKFDKDHELVNGRLKKGWTLERAMNSPKGYSEIKSHYITFNGETHDISEWAEILGIRKNTLQWMIRHGWSVEKALTTPVRKKDNPKKSCPLLDSIMDDEPMPKEDE